jgi:hypothetical protein
MEINDGHRRRTEEDRPVLEESARATKCLKPTHPLVLVLFEECGSKIMNRKPGGSRSILSERFRAHFGVPPVICADIWLRLDPGSLPDGSKLEHLLWGCMLLKTYETETVACSLAGGVDEKTWRVRSWFFVDAVSQLESDVVRSILLS